MGRRGASARPGRAADPAETLSFGIVGFLRLASGELDPVQALVERRVDVDGDVLVAARLAEMFGAVDPVDPRPDTYAERVAATP